MPSHNKKKRQKKAVFERFFYQKIACKRLFLNDFYIKNKSKFGAKKSDLFLYNQAGGVASLNPQNQGQGRTLNGFNPPNPRGGEGQTHQLPPREKRCSGIAL